MLDEKDLQAIGTMMDEKLTEQKKEIMHDVNLLLENTVMQPIKTLAEGQEAILEKLVPRSRVDDLEEEVRFLKTVFRLMSEELQELKKAT